MPCAGGLLFLPSFPSMQRYYQTLTLKRHPGGRSSWCPCNGYAPFLVCIFRRFSAFLPISADFCRVKCPSFPSRESAGKKEGSQHSTPKTYSKRPRTSPFSHIPGKQALYFAFYGVFLPCFQILPIHIYIL